MVETEFETPEYDRRHQPHRGVEQECLAVMGCVVNGPGEAREADFGIAGGVGSGLVFRKGKVIRSVPENELIDALMEEIEKYENEGE